MGSSTIGCEEVWKIIEIGNQSIWKEIDFIRAFILHLVSLPVAASALPVRPIFYQPAVRIE